jgi:hypothetical protein
MEAASRQQAQGHIQSYLYQAYNFLAYAENEQSDEFKSFESLTITAKMLYDHYAKFVEGTTLRRGLPPFDEMRKVSLRTTHDYLKSNEVTKQLADNLARYQLPSMERFIPRAEEIKAPKVK